MNYRYTARKYTTTKQIRVGDIVELLSFADIEQSDNYRRYRGRVKEIHNSSVMSMSGYYWLNSITVDVTGFAVIRCNPQKLKLIEQVKSNSLTLTLSNYLNHGQVPLSLQAASAMNDRGIFLTYRNDLIGLIERRSIKLNKNHIKYKTLLPVFEKFSQAKHIPILKLASPNFKGLYNTTNAKPFWSYEKKTASVDVLQHNQRLKRRGETLTAQDLAYAAYTQSQSTRFTRNVTLGHFT